jgi:hypothetical protein
VGDRKAAHSSPEGFARWSLRLLEEKVVELHIVERASDNTIGRTLKKTFSNRIAGKRFGRVGRSISTPASRRTVRETLTSYSSHQANMPVTPSFQCTNSLRLLTAMTSINRPARIFAPL